MAQNNQQSTQQPSATTNKSRKNRARYDRKKRNRNRVAQQGVVKRKSSGPAKQYLSKCCGAPATKTAAGSPTFGVNASTGKPQPGRTGLGKWRCGACRQRCKVTASKQEGTNAPTAA